MDCASKQDESNMSKASGQIMRVNYFDGLPLSDFLKVENVQSVMNYKPRDDDIFIVSYPKCGSTWSHLMLALILRHGENFGDDFNGILDSGTILEVTGMKGFENMKRPCPFRTHLPFRLVPFSEKAKYIYVTRNPKDACVSFYHHFSIPANWPANPWTGTFANLFEMFISGKMIYGDFFDHLEGWCEERNRPNILFVTYEEMKENPEAAILKMASFVDDEKYAEPLRNDIQKLENILKYSNLKEMKAIINKRKDDFLASIGFRRVEKSEDSEGFKDGWLKMDENKDVEDAPEKPRGLSFVRKGIIGDWRNHFSEEQSRRLDEKFKERTKNIEIAKILKQYM